MKRTAMPPRRTGLSSRTPLPRGARLAGVSPKRRRELAVYGKVRAEYMAAHPSCEWCGRPAEELHHRRGRVGSDLTDPAHFAALCSADHRRVTENPAWALSVGLSEPRIGRAS